MDKKVPTLFIVASILTVIFRIRTDLVSNPEILQRIADIAFLLMCNICIIATLARSNDWVYREFSSIIFAFVANIQFQQFFFQNNLFLFIIMGIATIHVVILTLLIDQKV